MREGISSEKTKPHRRERKDKSPENLVEKVSLAPNIVRAVEVMSERIRGFKEKGRKDIIDAEYASGLSREEIKDARSGSGVLQRLDELFVKADYLVQEMRSFFVVRFSRDMKAPFSPEADLKTIRKLPRLEKRMRVEKYKENLAHLWENIARLQDELVQEIRKNSDLPLADYMKFIHMFAAQKKLGQLYVGVAENVLREYKEKHDAIWRALEKFPNPHILFAEIFGQAPKGKIEVISRPMTLFFRCYDLEDYTHALQSAVNPEERQAMEGSIKNTAAFHLTRSPKIPELANTLVIENASVPDFLRHEKVTFDHEEQHAIHDLLYKYVNKNMYREGWVIFKGFVHLPEFGINMRTKTLMKRYLRALRPFAEQGAKNEILAYKKEGESSQRILHRLTRTKDDVGLYDFLWKISRDYEDILVDVFAKKHKDGQPTPQEVRFVLDTSHEVFRDEYVKMIGRGVAAFDALMDYGFSTEQAIGFLIAVPLDKWQKTVLRFLKEKGGGLGKLQGS